LKNETKIICVDTSDTSTDGDLYSLAKFCCWPVWKKLQRCAL